MNEMDELVSAFEAGRIEAAQFPHERHVRVTWGLAQRYPPQQALQRLIAGIRRIAERAGHADHYHETITRAWFALITAADDLDSHPELFDKALLQRYYSAEVLADGRQQWREPDLHPLALPPGTRHRQPDQPSSTGSPSSAARRLTNSTSSCSTASSSGGRW
jgi:hypothetical protein